MNFCVLSHLHLSLFSSLKNAIWFRRFSHSLILSICFIFAGPVVGSFHFLGSQSPQSILNVEKVLSFLCSIGICWTWGPFGRTCLLAGWAVLGVYTGFQCFERSSGMLKKIIYLKVAIGSMHTPKINLLEDPSRKSLTLVKSLLVIFCAYFHSILGSFNFQYQFPFSLMSTDFIPCY